MTTSTVRYLGQLSTINTHVASGTTITTDAPVDNNGLGRSFAPTDLVATALADCLLTNVAIMGNRHQFSIEGARAEVTKVMTTAGPRRIAEIIVHVYFPSDQNYTAEQKKMIEAVGKSCPVSLSLHPDINQVIEYHY